MLVDTILKDKGAAVATLDVGASLADAARLLDERRIGAVVILDEAATIRGVLSERDIVRCLARSGGSALGEPVCDVMSRGVITAAPTEDIDSCLERMTDRRFRHLPVVDAGRLVGIISIGDLVKWKISSVTAEAEAMSAYIRSG
jgi:CBS domain-containing protein